METLIPHNPKSRRRGSRKVAPVLIVLISTMVASGCDPGLPSAEDQMRRMGVPLNAVMEVNEETKVTLWLHDGKPEFVIFNPYPFGGWEPHPWLADLPTVGGGEMGGQAYSLGPAHEATGGLPAGFDPGFCYLFGAGQGPIKEVHVSSPDARWQIVNPSIGGWVIVVSETVGLNDLELQLIGPDDEVVFSSPNGWRASPFGPCGAVPGASPT